MQNLYTPVHFKPEYVFASNKLNKTEDYYRNVLQIPIEPSISSSEFKIAVKACLESIKYLCQGSVIPDFEHIHAVCHSLKHLKRI